MQSIAIFTTTGSADEAHSIARMLVERRLAACAQISEIESVYQWQGVLQNDKEYRLLIKTTKDRYAAVEAAIRELHSYELPAIFSLLVDETYAPYREWVAQNSAGSEREPK